MSFRLVIPRGLLSSSARFRFANHRALSAELSIRARTFSCCEHLSLSGLAHDRDSKCRLRSSAGKAGSEELKINNQEFVLLTIPRNNPEMFSGLLSDLVQNRS